MAKGDEADIVARLRRYIPPWFGYAEAEAPVEVAAQHAPGWALSFNYSLVAFARLQMRAATATGGWLELTSNDFFGGAFPRRRNATDDQYRLALRKEVFRDRNTLGAIDSAVFDLTGTHPVIFEGFKAEDTGGYDMPVLAYDLAGEYGVEGFLATVIIDVQTPEGFGIPNVQGWDSTTIGYDFTPFQFSDDAVSTGDEPTIQEILAALNRVRTAGVTYFVRFVDS